MKSLAMSIGLVLLFHSLSVSQSLLSSPESVVYDSARNRYLVSNYTGGRIIAIDDEGTQSVFAEGKNSSAGLHIVEDTLYVGCGAQGVIGYNLVDTSLVMDVLIPGSVLLNDIESDTSGNIWVSDPYGDKVYRISLSDHSWSAIVDPIVWPNGLLFDPKTNRMLVCGSTTEIIYSIDPSDGSYVPLTIPLEGHLDGLAWDSFGNIYVSAQGPDAVYRYDSTFSAQPKLICKGFDTPADICFNQTLGVLAVPNILGTSVTFVDMSQPDFLLCARTAGEPVGDGNGRANPGETVEVLILARNYGQDIHDVTGEMRCSDTLINILNGSAGFGEAITFGDTAVSHEPFLIAVDSACPDPYIVLLEVDFYYGGGSMVTDTCYWRIGEATEFYNDMEGSSTGWSHRPMTKPYVDEWHEESYRSHSGSTCWKAGGAASEGYADLSDGALITPPLLLPPDARFSFWHWMEAEGSTMSGAPDGGVVMMSLGDGLWQRIDPVDPYAYAIANDSASPFDPGAPCFSGSHDWTRAVFDLSEYTGTARFMFRFGSNSTTGLEGWYIDDVWVGNTLAGTEVTVALSDEISVTFDEVTGQGTTTASGSGTGPEPPAGFMAIPIDASAYHDISSSAAFAGAIEVCVTYEQEDVGSDESEIKLFHYELGAWVEITSSRDIENNVICGETSSLSSFIVARSSTCCLPPTVGDIDQSGGVDITDISVLIDNQFLTLTPLVCEDEGDIDFSGITDITDLSILIDNQFLSLTPLPPCP